MQVRIATVLQLFIDNLIKGTLQLVATNFKNNLEDFIL